MDDWQEFAMANMIMKDQQEQEEEKEKRVREAKKKLDAAEQKANRVRTKMAKQEYVDAREQYQMACDDLNKSKKKHKSWMWFYILFSVLSCIVPIAFIVYLIITH